MIYLIVGPKRAGKTTCSKILADHIKHPTYELSSPIKDILCKMFEINHNQLEALKILNKPIFNGLTMRNFLQNIGEGMKEIKYDENYWCKQLFEIASKDPFHTDFIVSDCRFLHEYNYFKQKDKVFVIRIEPQTPEEKDEHISENDWKRIPYNIKIINDKKNLDIFKSELLKKFTKLASPNF